MYNSDKYNWIAYVHRGWDRNLTGWTRSLSHSPENGHRLLQLRQIEKWCLRKVFEWIKATLGNLCSPLISKVRRPLNYEPRPNSSNFIEMGASLLILASDKDLLSDIIVCCFMFRSVGTVMVSVVSANTLVVVFCISLKGLSKGCVFLLKISRCSSQDIFIIPRLVASCYTWKYSSFFYFLSLNT